MLVSTNNFQEVIYALSKKQVLALDCETSGLRPYHGDSIFAFALHDGLDAYLFNFQTYPGLSSEFVLPRKESFACFQNLLFQNSERLFLAANAKFDMHFLAQEGCSLQGSVWDVLVMARIERNDYLSYSLASCGERIGQKKDEAVEEYISKHRLYEKVSIPGKKSKHTLKFYDRVPFTILHKYAEKDVEVTFRLYEHQRKVFDTWNQTPRPIELVIRNEMDLTKVCFEIERRGLLLDRAYCERAIEFETVRASSAIDRFKDLSGVPLVDSRKTLSPVFEKFGLPCERTEKGNESFTDDLLSTINHPIAKTIQDYRDATKKANTYYKSFIYYSDREGVVRPNIRQSATATGRFAITEPALQTLTNEEGETGFKIRSSFKAREGFKLVELDYKNMEFRAAIDQAEELEMAKLIGEGYDPHQAAADMAGITRREAKTLNFLVLYGGGTGKLATSLGISMNKAEAIRAKYFSGLKRLKRTISESTRIAENRGYIFNKFNRRYTFSDKKFAYKSFNHWDQGSCADAVKFAMVKIHEFLQPYKSKMVLQVHDSILFEVALNEEYLVPQLAELMKSTWKPICLGMDVSSKEGNNWGELC